MRPKADMKRERKTFTFTPFPFFIFTTTLQRKGEGGKKKIGGPDFRV